MSNWKTVRLGEVINILGGGTPKTTNDSYWGGHIPWLSVKDFNNGNKYVYTTEKTITDEGLNNSSTQLLKMDDIIISARGTVGELAVIPYSMAFNQSCYGLRGKKDVIEQGFLYYLLKFSILTIKSNTHGSVFDTITRETFNNIEVNLPPLAEQERIAGILGALDDKIECNNRINRNLEEQAAALFRRWFVDFEFPDPDPTSPTYGKPYRSSCGTFTDSPLGSIPQGWQIGTFRDIISSTIGGDWGKESAEANYSQKVYCIRGADITDVSKGEKGKMPFRYILPKNHIAKKLEVNDLVIEISGGSPTQSTGRIAIISDSLLKRYDEDMICTNFCRAIKPKTEYAHFIYSLWRYMYDQNIMFSYENGTTGIKNLNINGLVDNEQIVIPPIEVLNNYNNLQKYFFNTVFTNALESETLATLRDTLLPKLMNNEI